MPVQLDITMQKKEVGPLLYTIYKNLLKTDQWYKHKSLRRKYMGNLQNLGFDSGFLDITWKVWVRKGKNG